MGNEEMEEENGVGSYRGTKGLGESLLADSGQAGDAEKENRAVAWGEGEELLQMLWGEEGVRMVRERGGRTGMAYSMPLPSL